jgi:hypothetical protein
MNCDREGTTMDILNFIFKLLKHGGIFLLRVVGILAPALVGAFAAGAPTGRSQTSDREYGCYPDGTPYYENSSHAQWEAYYGDRG